MTDDARAGLGPLLPAGWAEGDAGVAIGGVSLSEVASRFGTPCYVVDVSHIRARLRAFREAFGGDAILAYAGKAGLYGALVRLLAEEGWWVDVVSVGELEVAVRGGVPPGRTLLHGNAKPERELAAAVARGIGRVVVDHPGEVHRLARAAGGAGEVPVLVRLNADVAAVTHEKVRTTGARAQFGMDAATAAEAVRAARAAPGVRPAGVHIHAGSQIVDVDTFRRAAAAVVDFAEPLRGAFGETVDLDVGGGLAVPYRRGDPAPSPAEFARAVRAGLEGAGARPGAYRTWVEPGRSVVATAGVTLYRVEARKRLPDGREVVAVDGGLSDNPRPALYGQSYEVLPVRSAGHDEPGTRVRVVGRHCETGDRIAEDAALPASLGPGDLVAVPVTGAYAYSMASRYNGLGRPPIVWIAGGEAREVVRREGIEDLVACDRVLAGDAGPGG